MRATWSAAVLAANALAAQVHTIEWRTHRDDETSNEAMQNLTAAPGDTLRFEWDEQEAGFEGIPHNVVKMKQCNIKKKQKWDNFQCGDVQNMVSNGKGTVIEAVELGDGKKYAEYEIADDDKNSCFVCTIGNHCSRGQHTSVKVVAPPPMQHDMNVWIAGMPESLRTLEVEKGDKIKFSWKGNWHNVWQLVNCDESAAADQFDCEGLGAEKAGVLESPYTHTVTAEAGERLCFYCEVGSHCISGQYLVADVVEKLDVNLDEVLNKCKTPDADELENVCKACGGEVKDNGKCHKIKNNQFKKMSCAKIRKSPLFCASVGCVAIGDDCAGTLGKGL